MLRRVVIAVPLAASLVFGLTADAGARVRRLHAQPRIHKASTSTVPTITSVSPLKTNVGQKLTILGKHFRAGKNRNRVFFLRQGGGIASGQAEYATRTRIVVTIPDAVTPLLRSTSARTLFQIRILTKEYGKSTKPSRSPWIGPSSTETPGGGNGGLPDPNGDCNHDGIPNRLQSDADADGIADTVEVSTTHTDPCKADTDGDGIGDGYEWQSAKDLNNTTPFNVPDAALPYPGKRPWPNPLDPNDANIDHDGDGLTMADEYKLNLYYNHGHFPLSYSDGLQVSKFEAVPADPRYSYMDMDHNGVLSDDERDADGDHLGNWDEKYGRMTSAWWDGVYDKETHYYHFGMVDQSDRSLDFPGVSMTDPDTDGDGVPDGADDQDHDGLSNSFEISRPIFWQWTYVSVGPGPVNAHDGVLNPAQQAIVDAYNALPSTTFPVVAPNPWARVQPYNPCKPVWSKTCHLHWPVKYYKDDEDWMGPDPSVLKPPPVTPEQYAGES